MRRLALALGVPAALAIGQQQLLVQLPPQLQHLSMAPSSSGPAALQLRFSRPMERASLERGSKLVPPLRARWLGDGSALMLSLDPGQRLNQPLQLSLNGRDQRHGALTASTWLWDPRPRLLAVVPVAGGEQLQLRQHNGRWQPISPIWPQIAAVEPLGDGSGVVVAIQDQRRQQVWRIGLRQRNLSRLPQTLAEVQASAPQPLGPDGALSAHLSSNRRGDLLLQLGGIEPTNNRTLWWPQGKGMQSLNLEASGPMRLLPQGGAVVVPGSDGLGLHDLPPRPPRRQVLPGSRDLSSFCPEAGRALLTRHWPDYRRSLELVEPGQPPRQLWIGDQALVASSCSGNGERIWLALVDGVQRPVLTLLALDRQGRVLRRARLTTWELEPGTGLSHDPSTQTLLAALRPMAGPGALATSAQAPAQPVLIDATSLKLHPLAKTVTQALWLTP